MNVRTVLIPLLCLGAVAFACGPRAHSEASLASMSLAEAVRSTPKPQRAEAEAKRHGCDEDHTEPLPCRSTASTLRFTLDVTNVGRKNVELTFPDGQTHDFAVLDSAGREVYRWGADRMFTQSVQNRTIDSGETLHIAEHATPTLPQGSYVAVATLRSTNFPVQERVAFELR